MQKAHRKADVPESDYPKPATLSDQGKSLSDLQ